MTTRERVFRKAANCIKVRGFTKGEFQNHNGYCALGAIRWAAMELNAEPYIGYWNERLVQFNDKEGTTKTKVIARLRSMADKAAKAAAKTKKKSA